MNLLHSAIYCVAVSSFTVWPRFPRVKLFLETQVGSLASPGGDMTNPEVLIRKYSERRLYDTGASRYEKLDEIARMVRDGSDIRVEDGVTGRT